MKVSELLAKSILTATGKSTTLTEGDKNWTKLLQEANIFLQTWATEANADWQSLYDSVDCGKISTTDTYDLDSSIQRISNKDGDSIKIVNGDKVYLYTLVPVDELTRREGNICARFGSSLKFNKIFTTDSPEYGGTLFVPSYTYPPTLIKGTDTVSIDDPMWLVFMTAAEWVRSDITLSYQYPNLIALATNAMSGMKYANKAQSSTITRRPAVPNTRSF